MRLLGKIVVIERHGEDGTEFPFTPPFLFGRKLDCDIPIQLPQVSDEHCKIELNEDNEFILTNLSSVNPTLINGQVLNQSERLKHGDLITIIDCSFRFKYPPLKTLTAEKDKTVQALQDQQEQSTPVHGEEKSEHSFDTCLKDGSNLPPSVDQSVELYQMPKQDHVEPWKSELPKTPLARPQVNHEEAKRVTTQEPVFDDLLSYLLDEDITDTAIPQSSFPANQEEKPADDMPSVGSITPSLTEKDVTPVSQKKRTPLKTPQKFSADTCLKDGSNLPPSEDQSVENDPFFELVQMVKQDLFAKSPSVLPKTPLARPQVDHEEAPAADVKSPKPVTTPELAFEDPCFMLDEYIMGPAFPQSSFPASQEEKTVDDMPSVGSITPSSTEKDVTPVSQKKRTPLKTPQKFSAGELVQHIRLEPQPEEKTPKSPEGRRSVGSQDQSLDLQMPLGQPQTPGPVGKNTEVKMSRRTSSRSNAGKSFQVQGVAHEIEAIQDQRLQEWTGEFIKMRADNDHLFTEDDNSDSVGWRTVLKKMGLLETAPSQARKKWKYLKNKYYDCKCKGASAETWKWFAHMDKVLGQRHSTNPPVLLASIPEDTPGPSSAVDDEVEVEPRPPPAKRKRGHVDELVKTSDESTQSRTQTQAKTTQPGSPDSTNVPALCTPKTSRHALASKRRAEADQPCVLNGINSKPDEEEYFLLSLAGALRHLPPRSRSEVKIKFHQILYEAEFNNQ